MDRVIERKKGKSKKTIRVKRRSDKNKEGEKME